MDRKLPYLIYKETEMCLVKKETLIIQVIELDDLKCLKEETIITNSKN